MREGYVVECQDTRVCCIYILYNGYCDYTGHACQKGLLQIRMQYSKRKRSNKSKDLKCTIIYFIY